MKFTASLTAVVLLATSAVAAPRERTTLAQRVEARQRKTLPPQFVPAPSKTNVDSINETQVEYSGNWAGAVLEAPPSGQTFTAVSARFVVPRPSVPSGGSGSYSASAWVGIDGDTYQNAILQTGVDFTASSSGGVSFDCWYEWFPDYAYDFSGISINAGDTIEVSVQSSGSQSGSAKISNLSNGQTVSKNLNAPSSSSSLGGQNAEWIVEDFNQGSSQVPFANFGTVKFTDAAWKASGGSSGGTSGASILDIKQGNKVYTTSSTPSNSEVDVKYTG